MKVRPPKRRIVIAAHGEAGGLADLDVVLSTLAGLEDAAHLVTEVALNLQDDPGWLLPAVDIPPGKP